jgi:uncharacterized membrane protein
MINYRKFIYTLIKAIIGSFIAGYLLASMPFGFKKLLLIVLIIFMTFFIAGLSRKIVKNHRDGINQVNK